MSDEITFKKHLSASRVEAFLLIDDSFHIFDRIQHNLTKTIKKFEQIKFINLSGCSSPLHSDQLTAI